jgi:hypothetical protein
MQHIIDATHFASAIDPAADTLQAISREMQKDLVLFGFDVIRDSATGLHSVIDVNYWPGMMVDW